MGRYALWFFFPVVTMFLSDCFSSMQLSRCCCCCLVCVCVYETRHKTKLIAKDVGFSSAAFQIATHPFVLMASSRTLSLPRTLTVWGGTRDESIRSLLFFFEKQSCVFLNHFQLHMLIRRATLVFSTFHSRYSMHYYTELVGYTLTHRLTIHLF